MGGRIAAVRVEDGPGREEPGGEGPAEGGLRRRLTRVLLAGSPRVMLAGPGLGRLDARGWGRRGGDGALGRALLEAAREEGFDRPGVGIADVAVAADAAARLAAGVVDGAGEAAGGPPATTPGGASGGTPGAARLRVVPPGEARAFLAPLPLSALSLPGDLRETLRALGLRRVGDLARLDRREVEARLGPEGVRARARARGEDERVMDFGSPDSPPTASLELDAPARSTEPLLFALRRLLHRLCADLADEGRCVARLTVTLALETGEDRAREVAPARPTRREDLLLDLCRAAVEGGSGLPGPVTGLSLRVDERAPAEARQRDLFAARARDPLRAAAALSRLRARLGPGAVARPAPGDGHRPEARNAWTPVGPGGDAPGRADGEAVSGDPGGEALPGVLRLLPEPEPVEVSCREGRPVALRDRRGRHRVEAAEGPEGLSGDWWKAPYAREYWWVCTHRRELLWIFREHPPRGGSRWRLHGWWD